MAFIIKFYEPRAPYGEFSNFLVRSIVVNGITWPVGTEQFFQAMKTLDKDMQEYIRTKLSRPGQIKNFCSPGGSMGPMRADWDESLPGLSDKQIEFWRDRKSVV